MNRSRLHVFGFTLLLMLGICLTQTACAQTQAPTTAPAKTVVEEKKTVYLLAVGNSFSGNASTYLRQMAEAGGNKLVFGHAMIGGCPLEKHWNLAQKHEADPNDPAGKPYNKKKVDGKEVSESLKDLLLKEKWEYITIQQYSMFSFKKETFYPHAQNLVDYIHKYAPQAKILVHETWAYRADQPIFKDGFSDVKMYQALHENYTTIAKEVGAERVIPVGTAFMNALTDPQWQFAMPADFDKSKFTPPELPEQKHSLHTGYRWDTKKNPPALAYDGNHAGTAGCYLGGAVWYEVFFGDVRGNSFVPKNMTQEDVTFLQNIAHKTVTGGLTPVFKDTK